MKESDEYVEIISGHENSADPCYIINDSLVVLGEEISKRYVTGGWELIQLNPAEHR